MVNRGKGDPRNIMGIILDRDERELKRKAVHSGIFKGRFARNQFDLCPQKPDNYEDIRKDMEVGLREAVHQESNCGGQGFTKCNCAVTGKGCRTNRYKCFKDRQISNSRCHSSLTCENTQI